MTRSTRASSRSKLSSTPSVSASAEKNVTNKKKKPSVVKKSNKKKAAKKANSTPFTEAAAVVTVPSGQRWHYVFTRGDEEYDRYMREEWSFEKRGDRALFEKLCLEGAQSGLSWLTILRKREAYRREFHDFNPSRVAAMTDRDVERILQTEPTSKEHARDVIVRHRGKIEATINNAKCLLEMQQEANDMKEEMTLDTFLWSFVEDKPILNRWSAANFATSDLSQCPSKTPESEAMSKALKKLGWKFVGPTTCYAMMQSVGMVIDHPVSSPEWQAALARLQQRPGGYQDRDTAAKT